MKSREYKKKDNMMTEVGLLGKRKGPELVAVREGNGK
jgi:hypothetical protein